MLLIVESDVARATWFLYDNESENPIKIHTKGIAPQTQAIREVERIIRKCVGLNLYKDDVKQVCFFGVDLENTRNARKIKKRLGDFFQQSTVEVYPRNKVYTLVTDADKAVVCVLDKRSNCFYAHQEQIVEKTPSDSHVLMDDSGNFIGKELLKTYFYKKMPPMLKASFEHTFQINEANVVRKIYHSSTPNDYLKEFALFLLNQEEHPFVKKTIHRSLELFIDNYILLYKQELQTAPLYFMGEVAYTCSTYIDEALDPKQLIVEKYIANPINEIAKILKTKKI